jgi:hypothetical protein
MTIHYGFEDPYEVPEDYTGEDEAEDYIRWQRWHDEFCTDDHYVPAEHVRIETINPYPYL